MLTVIFIAFFLIVIILLSIGCCKTKGQFEDSVETEDESIIEENPTCCSTKEEPKKCCSCCNKIE